MDSDRLSGWKEIAAHLRRSVRAAQRWEHELGLPVKRVKTVAGHVVFASRTELDAWLAQQQSVIHAEPVDPADLIEVDSNTDEPLVDQAPPSEPAPANRRRRPLLAAAAAAIVLVALGAWAWWPPAAVPLVHSVTIAGKVLHARSVDGRVLWQHEFDEDAEGLTLTNFDRAPSFEGVDLDGDGQTEWLVPLRFGDLRRGLFRSDAVAAFSERGQLRWITTVPSDFVLTCGGLPVQGPWELGAMSVSTRPGRKSVWIAFHHPVRWPSFAVEVTPDGVAAHRYVQPGWIKGLLERDTPSGRQIEIAGVLNDRERASLVSIDPTAPFSTLPAATPEFACDTREAMAPRRVVLFPPHDVTAAYQYKFFLATGVYRHGDGLRVNLSGGSAVAMLDAGGTVTDITFIDDYWLQHDGLFRDGRLNHPSDSCPLAHTPGDVESWDGHVWSSYPVRRVIPSPSPRRP